MASVILSHQAPAILLKMAFPKYIDGTAACIAATLPDCELVFYRGAQLFAGRDQPWQWGVSHNLIGLFVIALPLTVLGTYVFSKWCAMPLASFAGKEGKCSQILRYFGVDQWGSFNDKRFTCGHFVVVLYSALAGALSHFLLDAITHNGMRFLYPLTSRSPNLFEDKRFLDFGMVGFGSFKYDLYLDSARVSWVAVSVAAMAITLFCLRYITRKGLWSKYCEE